jgi:ATP-dependent RNA helicase DDX46/PRP5
VKTESVEMKEEIVVTSEPVKREAVEEEEEDDPLDAYMRAISGRSAPKAIKTETLVAQKKVTIIASVVKSTPAASDKKSAAQKGAIMEQGQDALEFLSDDEQAPPHSSEPNFEEMHIDQLPKIKTKSEQVSTDHTKVYYRPFRKNFYVEVPDIAKMTQAEVDAMREELEGIKVAFLLFIYRRSNKYLVLFIIG